MDYAARRRVRLADAAALRQTSLRAEEALPYYPPRPPEPEVTRTSTGEAPSRPQLQAWLVASSRPLRSLSHDHSLGRLPPEHRQMLPEGQVLQGQRGPARTKPRGIRKMARNRDIHASLG